jgi:hypothetical protein
MTLEIVTTVAASIVALRKHLITMIINDATTQDKALLIQKILGDITYATTYLKTHLPLPALPPGHESTQALPSSLVSL